jgi:hypothetical protein
MKFWHSLIVIDHQIDEKKQILTKNEVERESGILNFIKKNI